MRSPINRVGKYELKAVLARTPASTVYDGWDFDIARRVAVKMMPLSAVDDNDHHEVLARFKRGAQAAGRLSHPNIVAVYDYGEADDYAYLVMEFIDGPTLKDRFDKNERPGIAEIGEIISGLLEALEYSHEHGVVHRDIKPANIMFTRDKKIKITDFGIARLEDSEMTQTGTVIRTPAYMSPEQFLGQKIDLRTDIYSTGVVLYHLLTGERPYEGNLTTIMHKVLHGSPPLPSRLSGLATPALDRIVGRAMARSRGDRYSSAAGFHTAMQSMLSPTAEDLAPIAPSAASQVSPVQPPSANRSVFSRRGTMLAALAFIIAVGGFAAWQSYSKPVSPRFLETAAADVHPAQPAMSAPEQRSNSAENASGATPSTYPPDAKDLPLTVQKPKPTTVVQINQVLTQYNNPPEAPQDPLYLERPHPGPIPEHSLVPALPLRSAITMDPQNIAKPTIPANDKQPASTAIPKDSGSQPEPARGHVDPKVATSILRSGKQSSEPPDHALLEEDASVSTLRRLRAEQINPKMPPFELATPPPIYASTSISSVGLVCQTVTTATAGDLGLDTPQGMVVTGVAVGSAAAKAGLRQDDVILKIGGLAAQTLAVLTKVAAETAVGEPVPVEISRHGKRQVMPLSVDQLRH